MTIHEIHRRRDSGDSVSQWWHWQENNSNGGRPVVRSTSLKGDLNNQRHQPRADECEDDDDDEVFVTGHRSQGQVKSAMIVSAAGNNPYCTGSREGSFQCV